MDYKKDYYALLGVDEKATRESLRDAYRRLAKIHHPDKNPNDPNAEDRFKEINEAYEILSNGITRGIYDDCRTGYKQEKPVQSDKPGDNTAYTYKPFGTKKSRTNKIKREEKVYIEGTIEVKFQGEPELTDTYLWHWEQRFTIVPTEVLVTIYADNISTRNGADHDAQNVADIFTTALKQPVTCRIITGESEEYYSLDLYEIRVTETILKDITRHDEFSFGTLQGNISAYVPEFREEMITEDYTEYSGYTGKVETKTEGGYIYTRNQMYKANGDTDWEGWKRTKIYTANKHYSNGSVYSSRTKGANGTWISWAILLITLVAIWPKILFFLGPLLIGALLLALLGWAATAFNKVLPWIGGLFIGILIFSAVRSLFRPSPVVVPHTARVRSHDAINSEREVVRQSGKQPDTIISHIIDWRDRDSASYTIRFSVSSLALNRSMLAHNNMDYQQYSWQGIGAVYCSMLAIDSQSLHPIASAFESIATARSLTGQPKASMVISCIQSIPYSLVMDGACSSNYNDEFVRQYLSTCKSNCCKGYSKFGVQSPVEFIADLQGDCDTRALLLYEVLGKLGYKVALMTSTYYRHALIAVQLDDQLPEEAVSILIDGKPYYLWETTSTGFGPGQLPPTISNTNHWDIALIQ